MKIGNLPLTFMVTFSYLSKETKQVKVAKLVTEQAAKNLSHREYVEHLELVLPLR